MKKLFAAVSLLALAGAAGSATADEFSFVAMGDMPYGKPEKVYAPFEQLITTINATDPEIVVHIGDTKSGGTLCSDEMLTDQLNFMNSIDAAVLYTPGDNEWTDCHRKKAGGMDPLDRLDFIRKTYFTEAKTLGKDKVDTIRQSDSMAGFETFVENARFTHHEVMFTAVHVMGSNNNFEVRDPKATAEFFARDAANIAWIKDSFAAAEAEGAKAVVVNIHADMFNAGFNAGKETWNRQSGFLNWGKALVKAAAGYGKPVLLIYGDSHRYHIHRPFVTSAPNIVALEVFGAKHMHAVEIMVDTDHPAVFGYRPLMNPAVPVMAKKDY